MHLSDELVRPSFFEIDVGGLEIHLGGLLSCAVGNDDRRVSHDPLLLSLRFGTTTGQLSIWSRMASLGSSIIKSLVQGCWM